jgi:hypothetical protein
MSKIWRWVAPVAVVGGLLAASGAVPAEAASTAVYGINIHAKNPNFRNVTGDTLVVLGVKTLQNATVSGTVTGATTGDVVTLLAEPFKATHFTAVGHKTLTSATEGYSFSVRPGLATKYEARVTTGSKVDITSKMQAVYVTLANTVEKNGVHFRCTRTQCTLTIKTRTFVPRSAYLTESRKHWYLYLGVNRSHGIPSNRAPRFLTLSRVSTASKARKLTPTAFQVIFTFRMATHG